MKTILFLLCLFSSTAFAKDLGLVQGRVFIANTNINPTNVNDNITNEGLKKLDKTMNFGVEITFPALKFFEAGMRYTHRQFDADPTNSATSYQAKGTQESILLLARVPIIKASMFRFDVFGGVGGNNTKLSIKSSAYDGELTKTAASDWFATPYYSAGASAGFGFHNVYLYAEGGYEYNKVNNFKKSGTVNPNINTLDLRGNYFMIGLMFDGIKGFTK